MRLGRVSVSGFVFEDNHPMIEQMPTMTPEELEVECLKVLKYDPHTREITHVGIIRLHPEGSGPNWTFSELEPMPTAQGSQIARDLIARVSGTIALAD
jgi:hypothetical protein